MAWFNGNMRAAIHVPLSIALAMLTACTGGSDKNPNEVADNQRAAEATCVKRFIDFINGLDLDQIREPHFDLHGLTQDEIGPDCATRVFPDDATFFRPAFLERNRDEILSAVDADVLEEFNEQRTTLDDIAPTISALAVFSNAGEDYEFVDRSGYSYRSSYAAEFALVDVRDVADLPPSELAIDIVLDKSSVTIVNTTPARDATTRGKFGIALLFASSRPVCDSIPDFARGRSDQLSPAYCILLPTAEAELAGFGQDRVLTTGKPVTIWMEQSNPRLRVHESVHKEVLADLAAAPDAWALIATGRFSPQSECEILGIDGRYSVLGIDDRAGNPLQSC